MTMGLILVLAIAASATCAQAAPQFDTVAPSSSRSTEFSVQGRRPTNHENRDHYGPTQQPMYPQNDHHVRNHRNYRGSSNQCWDPVNQAYRDWPNRLSSTPEYPSQFDNTDHLGPTNRNPPKNPNPHFADQSGGSWVHPQPPYRPPPHDYWNEYGPHPPPPPHHGHGHGPPPHHGHGYGHGPPHHHGHEYGHGPPHHHGHGHEHRPPPPPPDYGYGHGPPPPPYGGYGHGAPLPPQRSPHHPQDVNDDELEICTDVSEENTSPISVEPVGTTTLSVPISSSEALKNGGELEGLGDQAKTDSSVRATTEFDWNSFVLGASVDNPGGEGVIDVRGDFSSDTLSVA